MGIDTQEVIKAAGTKWNFLKFYPGLVGGHCIGVDPYYLTHKAEEVGYNPQVILAGRRINDNMGRYAARNIIKQMSKNGVNIAQSRVAVLGVTFKENCPDIRNSKVIDLIKELQQWNIEVLVADPWADADEVMAEYGIALTNIVDLNDMDGIAVAVAHEEFTSLTTKQLREFCRADKPVIADLKSIFDRKSLSASDFSIFRF